MANETRRLQPAVIAEDESAVGALHGMALYEPANQTYSLTAVEAALGSMRAARREEEMAEAALKTARDVAVQREWDFHNLMLAVKDQVTAQFGRDSNEVQAIGLKKSSERKAPQRRKKVGGTGGATGV